MADSHQFYTDKDVARLLRMSPSWVRVQRFKRRHSQPHVLDVEPRLIGSSPRYVRAEVEGFIDRLLQPREAGAVK